MIDRQLALQAERSVLGGMMLGGAERASQVLKGTDFCEYRHQLMFDHIVELWAAGLDVGPTSVLKRMADSGQLTRRETAPYLSSMLEVAAIPAQIGHYAQIVQEEAERRWQAMLADKMARAAEINDPAARRARMAEVAAELAAGVEASGAPQQEPAKPSLTFTTVAEMRARVRAAGPRRWLLRGLWPAGDYGVHAGEMKAQKSWNTVALAVAVASGTPWLGSVEVDLSGPVVMFAGEGGEADLLRRVDAVAAAAGIDADELPITICARAPHLSSLVHLGEMADQLDRARPVLTTLDPLYLSAGGAKGSDLYAMGELLERPQHLCQDAGSALWVATHTNRKEGRGASRITGAGPAEWGRVLATATVKGRKVNKATMETSVITELDFIGGSIPGGTLRVTRRIRADDPNDLDSPLRYSVTAEQVDEDEADTDRPKMPPARAKLFEALTHSAGAPLTVRALVDWVSEKHGHGLTRETCSRELNALLSDGLADRVDQGKGSAAEWFVTPAGQTVDL